MVYGYCRVSTKGQAKDGNSIEAQEAAVREAGAEEIYADAFTGTKKHRPQLDKLLKVIQDGDKVVVTKLDRIARSATQGIALIDTMLDKGVTVHILNMGIMDNTPTGRLIRTIMLAFAEFERDMIVERPSSLDRSISTITTILLLHNEKVEKYEFAGDTDAALIEDIELNCS